MTTTPAPPPEDGDDATGRDTSVHGNRYDNGPVVAVAVADKAASWVGGIFSGDADVIAQARRAADAELVVDVYGTDITADLDTPWGALAAMASYRPGRLVITQAPDVVIDMLDDTLQAHFRLVPHPDTPEEMS